MDSPESIVSKILLEKTQKGQATTLAKINCKIGDHYVIAHINTGSSISVASTELYGKLIEDRCTFKDGKRTLNLIDESIPNQEYRITKTTVKVIGQTKSIDLVAFPNDFIQNTTLGIDFLSTDKTKTKEIALFRVPDEPVCKPVVKNDNIEPVGILDWIMNTSNLKKPLYNILTEETADDEDLFAICAFMKKMPRMVSPIRDPEHMVNGRLGNSKMVNTRKDETSVTSTSSSRTSSASTLKSSSSSSNTSASGDTASTSARPRNSESDSISKASSTTKSPTKQKVTDNSDASKSISSTTKTDSSSLASKSLSSTSKSSPSISKSSSSTSKSSSSTSKSSSSTSKSSSSTSKPSSSASKHSSSESKSSSSASKHSSSTSKNSLSSSRPSSQSNSISPASKRTSTNK